MSAELGGTVSVIDVERHAVVATIPQPEGTKPMGVAISPDGERLFVANGRAGTVSVIDTKSRDIVGSVDVGERPWGLALSRDGSRLYTANGTSDDISVVNVATLEVVKRITVGDNPWGVAVAPRPGPR